MKQTFFLAVALLLCCACGSRPDGFVVRGSFPGLQNGMVVVIRNMESERLDTLAMDTVRNGKFELRGVTPVPRYCELQIHNRGTAASPRETKLGNAFLFLDNSELTVTVPHLDSMSFILPFLAETVKSQTRVEGGPVQRDFYAYHEKLLPFQLIARQFSDSLVMIAMYEYYHTPEEYASKYDKFYPPMQEAEKLIQAAKLEFIRQHPQSPVSQYVAGGLLQTMFIYTREEIEELKGVVEQVKDSVRRARLLESAGKALTMCKGAAYKEVELTDVSGETVKLSQYIHPGRYTIVDFWASWCGPCREAFPKVGRLYNRYDRSQLEVVSISLDLEKAAWEEAMQEENMPWTQLQAGNREQYAEACRIYNITGIPRLLLIGPDGVLLFSGNNANALRIEVEGILGK